MTVTLARMEQRLDQIAENALRRARRQIDAAGGSSEHRAAAIAKVEREIRQWRALAPAAVGQAATPQGARR